MLMAMTRRAERRHTVHNVPDNVPELTMKNAADFFPLPLDGRSCADGAVLKGLRSPKKEESQRMRTKSMPTLIGLPAVNAPTSGRRSSMSSMPDVTATPSGRGSTASSARQSSASRRKGNPFVGKGLLSLPAMASGQSSRSAASASTLPTSPASIGSPASPAAPGKTLDKKTLSELRRLSPQEALRQVLIRVCGSQEDAFRALDVNGDGEVTREEFRNGLEVLGIKYNPLRDEEAELETLFDEIDFDHSGTLSLEELLGFLPIQLLPEEDDPLVAEWWSYYNQSAASPSQFVRGPKWAPGTAERPLEPHQEAELRWQLEEESKKNPIGAQLKLLHLEAQKGTDFAERRRQMRMKLNEVRNSGQAAQRALVTKLVPTQDSAKHAAAEKSEVNQWKRRVEGHLQGCASAREELVQVKRDLTYVMPMVVSQDTRDLLAGLNGSDAHASWEARAQGH